VLCNFREALRLIPESSGDGSASCASPKLGSFRFGHLTPLHSTRAYYAGNPGLSIVFKDFFQNPRELHIEQWSQGLPLGSTEHFFSFSKNSTSSETAASSMPKRS